VVQSAFPHAVPFDDERVLTEERSTLMMSELATMTNLPQAIPIAALLSPMLGKWDHYDDPQSLYVFVAPPCSSGGCPRTCDVPRPVDPSLLSHALC